MTLSLSGTPEELKQLTAALADQIPALAPLKAIGLREGHADLTLDLPNVGGVVARVTIDVEPGGG